MRSPVDARSRWSAVGLVVLVLVVAAGAAVTGASTGNDIAAMLALALGCVAVAASRVGAPMLPAVAAPVVLAWPHGAAALAVGIIVAAAPLARTRVLPTIPTALALALAAWIAANGERGLLHNAAACVAIAVVTPIFVRSASDLRLAGAAFGLAAAAVGLGAALVGTTGVRADVLAVGAALGLAAAAGSSFRVIAVADLAAVLVLPSLAGLISAGVALVGLVLVRRLTAPDVLAAACAAGAAWLAGAPAADGTIRSGFWQHASGYMDTYHRVGIAGVVLLVALLLATLRRLPAAYAPALVAAAAGTVFVPLEAAAPIWLFAGFAASRLGRGGGGRPPVDEEILAAQAREIELRVAEIVEEQRKLLRRRVALDVREAALAERESRVAESPVAEPTLSDADREGREAELALLDAQIAARKLEIDANRRDLADQRRELDELRVRLAEQERVLELHQAAEVSTADEARRRDLDEHELRLEGLAAQVEREAAERALRASDRNATLELREQAIAQRERATEERSQSLVAKFKEREEGMLERERALTDRERAAHERAADLASTTRALDDRQKALELRERAGDQRGHSREDEIVRRERALVDREQRVSEIEEQVHQRVGALATAEQLLAQRVRELELRREPGDASRDRFVMEAAARARELDQRERALEEAERVLQERADALASLERAVEAQRGDLDVRVRSTEERAEGRVSQLSSRESLFVERERALIEREQVSDEREAALARAEQVLERREHDVARSARAEAVAPPQDRFMRPWRRGAATDAPADMRRDEPPRRLRDALEERSAASPRRPFGPGEPTQPVRRAGEPAAFAPPPPVPAPSMTPAVTPIDLQPAPRYWNLRALRGLARANAAGHPDRIEEWDAYFESLAPHAEDGVLPPAFDEIVWEVFQPLLGAPSE